LWVSTALDGDVYAQPLVVGEHVIIATENDTVYSLDARTGVVVWRRHLGSPVPESSLPCGDVDPVGITGTPVADVRTNRVYVVGLIEPLHHVLFVLDVATGRVEASTDVDASGSDPAVQNQRAALTLTDGNVYVPFGGRYGDCGDYHGRVVAVALTAAGLGSVTSYTLPTQRQGGFWAPPGAAVASDGTLYLASGNSASNGAYDYGNSVVRLSARLRLLDTFAPSNWASLNAGDLDVGSTSPVLLPAGRVLQIGKGGVGYLLDAAHLGGIGGMLRQANVCAGNSAFGGVAHDRDDVFVPCSNGIVQVVVHDDDLTTGWTASIATPGPPVVSGSTVWTVATGTGQLVALDRTSGTTSASFAIGEVPSRFTSPAVAGGRVVVAAGRVVRSFGA